MIDPVLDAEGAPEVTMPLGADPLLRAVNSQEALSHYIKSGDPSALTIPPKCALFTFKALDAQEFDAAKAAAGRVPHLGQWLVANAPSDLRENAIWLDGLEDDDLAAVEKYKAWSRRQHEAIAEAGVVRVTLYGDEGPVTYDSAARFLQLIPNPGLARNLLSEMAMRVTDYSGLAAGPKGLSGLVSGSKKPRDPEPCTPGSATDAPASGDSLGETAEVLLMPA